VLKDAFQSDADSWEEPADPVQKEKVYKRKRQTSTMQLEESDSSQEFEDEAGSAESSS
jgi:hypothetical protein